MRFGVVLALASSFFKSYFRSSSQKGPTLFFSKPKVMVGIDVALFFAPAFILQFLMGAIPVDYSGVLSPLVVRALVSLPLLITSAVIVSGLMFELGQGSAISSSEAVNWWPISPREYVAASALSTSSLYSAFLALAAGVTLPLAIKFGLFYAWPVVILLSAIALFLGAFIVELLKSSVNRVSSVAYKKSGRLTLAVRLIVLVFLFAIVQLAFQPAALSWFFGSIAGGVEVVWMVPFVWSSAAITSLLNYDVVLTVVYVLFSFLFTVVLYELSCQLRSRYWSPVPISITIDESTGYFPQSSI